MKRWKIKFLGILRKNETKLESLRNICPVFHTGVTGVPSLTALPVNRIGSSKSYLYC